MCSMESRDMNVRINKEKSIGKVLYIVEGNKTEALILYYIFCKIYDYQFESILRGNKVVVHEILMLS